MKSASNSIYFDHASITPPRPEVVEELRRVSEEVWGNPSSLHAEGRAAKAILDEAREVVAEQLFGASESEVVFTSGGTESNALALLGVVRHTAKEVGLRNVHIISQPTEHSCVLETLQQLEKEGVQVTWLPVNEFGCVDPEDVVKALTPETVLVSLMTANNEIGTIQPIWKIGEALKSVRPEVLFHTDACQAVLTEDLRTLGAVDLISVTGTKFGGPHVGALCVKKGVRLEPLWVGGGQERGRRSGTEAVPEIAALATAVRLAVEHREQLSLQLSHWRDELIQALLQIPDARLNGHPTDRLPQNVHLCFKDLSGETLLVALDQAGIAVSTGSACAAGSQQESHVLRTLGLPKSHIRGSLRLTLGWNTTEEEVKAAKQLIPQVITSLLS